MSPVTIHISQFNSEDFLQFVERSDFEETIRKEHNFILRKPTSGSLRVAAKSNNSQLNRLGLPNCFDHSRVILPVEKEHGDYINGNYVDGYNQARKFICMQAPMHSTNYDLWRTVWMSNSRIIVMLCEKTVFTREIDHAYWCYAEGTLKCEKFEIKTKKVEFRQNYTETTLEVTDGTGASREVLHLAFTTWRDKDVPETIEDFLDFVLAVKRINEKMKVRLIQESGQIPNPPIIVHSEMGANRAGAFCAIEIAMSQYNDTGIISLASVVTRIREQRYDAVFRFIHYLFCYAVLAKYASFFQLSEENIVKQAGYSMRSLFKSVAYPNCFRSRNVKP
uniref:Protein tyrosine phosphatase n=1 Tax=Glyptapanteles flavicoxis TaxID=463051 RepID=B7S8H9_9HYME|nr:protein tyrosine phosphatase [Glyptapanteles flavicoxis]